MRANLLLARQPSLQYFTLSQSRAHFLRQAKGRWHIGQILVGRYNFLCMAIEHQPQSFVFSIMKFTEAQIDRIIEMAWEDRTPFDAIKAQFGVAESEVIKLMRTELKPTSFKMWRKRVQGRATKHLAKRNFTVGTHKSNMQRAITANKLSKR